MVFTNVTTFRVAVGVTVLPAGVEVEDHDQRHTYFYEEPLAHRLRMLLEVDVIFNFGAKTIGHGSMCYD
jgi:hypothetical protein